MLINPSFAIVTEARWEREKKKHEKKSQTHKHIGSDTQKKQRQTRRHANRDSVTQAR